MLPRSQRLNSAHFDRAFAHSVSVRHPFVALKAHRRDDESDAVRAAFAVPKKQAKAVGRNRTRRRLRERYRLHPRRSELSGCDLIFLATPATHDATNDELDGALDEVIKHIGRKLGENARAPKREVEAGERAGLAPTSNRATGEIQDLKENQTLVGRSPSFQPEVSPIAQLEVGASPALSPASTEQVEPNSNAAQTSPFASLALSLIRFYQRFVSPGLPPSCRFYPSCSRYTYGAIERFGLARGLWLGSYRVCRCHPWNAGGIDEVPAQFPAPRALKERAVAKLKLFIARRRFDSPRN